MARACRPRLLEDPSEPLPTPLPLVLLFSLLEAMPFRQPWKNRAFPTTKLAGQCARWRMEACWAGGDENLTTEMGGSQEVINGDS